MKRKTGLGKGLSAILQDSNDEASAVNNRANQPNRSLNFQEIEIHEIEANPYQPRLDFEEIALQELADSIRIQGIIQPQRL